jgi:DNA repair exonuclease SbcCD nuclease subunit
MTDLFKKVAAFTDLHLGAKNNSQIHNNDCEEYIDWYIKTAKENNCETGIFLGDFSHNRNNINILTLDYSIRILEKLGAAFENFYFIIGNHDLYRKEQRDIHSAMFGKHIPGITIIDKPVVINDVLLCPWLISDESKTLKKKSARYVFGHFELPNFFMNSKVRFPGHGEFDDSAFKNYEYVFSGHFHMRQIQNNIHYIGNCFPHSYSDCGDNERGMMILEWGGEPQYYNWPNMPTFKTLKLSELLDNAETILKPRQFLRVSLDINISFEEASYIKEKFITDYQLRELTLVSEKKVFDVDESLSIDQFESVDTMVNNQLSSIESNAYNTSLLLELYNSLHV